MHAEHQLSQTMGLGMESSVAILISNALYASVSFKNGSIFSKQNQSHW
jgi:hypothetical protein